MSTVVTVNIEAPAADLTLHEPDNLTIPTVAAPNTQVACTVGHYANQGNVKQTVTFEGLTDVTNCTYVSHRWTLSDGSQVIAPDFELEVDTQALLEVFVQTANEPIGSEQVQATFTVNVSHVQAPPDPVVPPTE